MAQKFAGMELSATGLAASAASETNIVNNSFNKDFIITEVAVNQSSRFGIALETASNEGFLATTYIDATALIGTDDLTTASGSTYRLPVPIRLARQDGIKLIYQARSAAGSAHYIYVNLLGYVE